MSFFVKVYELHLPEHHRHEKRVMLRLGNRSWSIRLWRLHNDGGGS